MRLNSSRLSRASSLLSVACRDSCHWPDAAARELRAAVSKPDVVALPAVERDGMSPPFGSRPRRQPECGVRSFAASYALRESNPAMTLTISGRLR